MDEATYDAMPAQRYRPLQHRPLILREARGWLHPGQHGLPRVAPPARAMSSMETPTIKGAPAPSKPRLSHRDRITFASNSHPWSPFPSSTPRGGRAASATGEFSEGQPLPSTPAPARPARKDGHQEI